jgi:rRNA maturation endonuclease Nob1
MSGNIVRSSMGVRDVLPELVNGGTGSDPERHVECRDCGVNLTTDADECPDCGGEVVVYELP